jgi:hypothetical protein
MSNFLEEHDERDALNKAKAGLLSGQPMRPLKATAAVIRVGEGRGFVVKDAGEVRLGQRNARIVITAAHCLPSFPPCTAGTEHIYQSLLGPLGQEPAVWADCLFADPVADIAVLGEPGHEDLLEQRLAYRALVWDITPLRISDVHEEAAAQLLSLDGEWFGCKVEAILGGPLLITDAGRGIVGGMSGSPVLAEDGTAVGVVVVASCRGGELPTCGGPNPRLAYHLPARFLPRFR